MDEIPVKKHKEFIVQNFASGKIVAEFDAKYKAETFIIQKYEQEKFEKNINDIDLCIIRNFTTKILKNGINIRY